MSRAAQYNNKAAPGGSGRWSSVWLLGGLLGVLTVAAYWPGLGNGFIWDDDAHITANACIVGPLGLKEIWTTSAAVYYPLVLTSFWVLHAVWGLAPLPYHLVTVLAHAVCAVVLWRLLVRLGVRGAWLGAALWAVHPVNVESVAWATELKNTQSGIFFLLAIGCFVRWTRPAPGRSPGAAYALALLWAILAILSKASTVMLPVALTLCALWLHGRWRWRDVLGTVPFYVISGVVSLWTIWEQLHHSGAVGPDWEQTRGERVVVAGRVIWFYLGRLIWPHPLMFIYPRWEVHAPGWVEMLPFVAAVVALAGLWRWRGGGMRPTFLAFAYFVALLFPVLGFFNGYFFRYSFVGDHFQYLAALGPLALAGAGLTRLAERATGDRRVRGVLAAALLGVLGVLTWRQTAIYKDSETLWRDTLAHNPQCWLAQANLGVQLVNRGRIDEAIDHYREAIRIRPGYDEPHNNLGTALALRGNTAEAIVEFREAIRINPAGAGARFNLGLALAGQGQLDEAVRCYQEAIRLDPGDAEIHLNLGNALSNLGRVDEAIIELQEAVRLVPGYVQAHNNLGFALASKGRVEEAVVELREAVRLKPDFGQARDNLGVALVMRGRWPEAVVQFEEALRLDPNDAAARAGLARAQAARKEKEPTTP